MAEKKENIHAGHRQRVKSRFIEHGFDGMEPHQILELVLFYAIPRKDTNELAHRLLDRYGTIAHVCNAPIDVLEKDFGLSENAAVLLKMIPPLSACYENAALEAKYIDMHEAVKIMRPHFLGATTERVVLAMSDARDKLLFCDVVSTGSLTATDFPMRKIADYALRHNARYAYIAHNHPSGHCVPSQKDLKATRFISELLEKIGVMLVDHIIFTATESFSIRSQKHLSNCFVE